MGAQPWQAPTLSTSGNGEMENHDALRMSGIVKKFPGTIALDQVDFTVQTGEIHGLVGENGAGKSTLMNILNGAMQPDEGRIFLKGKEVKISSPHVGQQLGISMVHQELKLFPDLSVTENVFFGMQADRGLFVHWKELNQRAKSVLDTLFVNFSPKSIVKNLSIAQRQQVEIAKALSHNCQLFILDEPTASLTPDETRMLFKVIRSLVKEGISVVYISHRLEEILEICHNITVLRDGKKIGTVRSSETTQDEIVKMMIGSAIAIPDQRNALAADAKEEVLRVANLRVKGRLQDIHFSLHKGEVLGLAGLVGSGRTELLMALYGVLPVDEGEIYLHGRKVSVKSPQRAIQAGFALVPEDRKKQGLVIGMSLKDNITMSNLKKVFSFWFLRQGYERKVASRYCNELNIKASSINQKAISLSGGNQQKVIFAKWLFADTDILLLDEPTRGIDVGAKEEVFRVVKQLAAEGKSIIFVSSELTEVIRVSDRILVLVNGRMTKELPGGVDSRMLAKCVVGGEVA
jgi:ribose transport system ATP-binding protein